MSQVSERPDEDTDLDPFEGRPMPRINIDAIIDLTDDEKVIVRGIMDIDSRLRATCPELELTSDGTPTVLTASTACVWREVAFYISPQADHSRLAWGQVFWFVGDGERQQELSDLAQRVAASVSAIERYGMLRWSRLPIFKRSREIWRRAATL